MFEEKIKKFKELLKIKNIKEEGNNKRKIENLIVFIIILIITIILINSIWNKDKKQDISNIEKSNNIVLSQKESNISNNNNLELEEKLENILKNIQGVGDVKVLLTYSESSQTVAMYNEDSSQNDTEEVDKQGGSRKVSQTSNKKEVIYQEIDGEKVPVTKSILNPKVEGAVVASTGARK